MRETRAGGSGQFRSDRGSRASVCGEQEECWFLRWLLAVGRVCCTREGGSGEWGRVRERGKRERGERGRSVAGGWWSLGDEDREELGGCWDERGEECWRGMWRRD